MNATVSAPDAPHTPTRDLSAAQILCVRVTGHNPDHHRRIQLALNAQLPSWEGQSGADMVQGKANLITTDPHALAICLASVVAEATGGGEGCTLTLSALADPAFPVITITPIEVAAWAEAPGVRGLAWRTHSTRWVAASKERISP